MTTDLPSETFRRLAVLHPDRVGKVGFWADLDDYRIEVVDIGRSYKWSLFHRDRHVESAETIAAALAWQHACNALDRHAAVLADYCYFCGGYEDAAYCTCGKARA